jgi:two-component system response regulator
MNHGSILLVEDNPDDVALTMRAFKKNAIGNPIDVAADGAEAVRYLLATDRPLPALVLLDINLPKLSGLDVLRVVRADERTQFLPIVVLTTSNEERDIIESYNLRANSYVRKPVVFGEFLEAVRMLGMYWLLVNQPVIEPRAAGG